MRPRFVKYSGPNLVVDLKREGAERWREIIQAELTVAKRLLTAALEEFPAAAKWTSGAFGVAFRQWQGPYIAELEAWAKALEVSFGEIAMVNCGYEYSHLSDAFTVALGKLRKGIFGCTAAVLRIADDETVHVRNLDWPIQGMGPSTRVFEFIGGDHPFSVVGFPGFVGALSGMVPGEYSATINWAPPRQLPSFDYAPAFLLRETFQTCRTYQAAMEKLKSTPLSADVFFTVCGKDDGCVIERAQHSASLRPLKKGFVAQTNHRADSNEDDEVMSHLKAGDFLVSNTRQRLQDMNDSITASGLVNAPWNECALFDALDRGEVTNWETSQRMIFRPKTGELFLQTSV